MYIYMYSSFMSGMAPAQGCIWLRRPLWIEKVNCKHKCSYTCWNKRCVFFSSAPVIWWEHLEDNKILKTCQMSTWNLWIYILHGHSMSFQCVLFYQDFPLPVASNNFPLWGRVSESWPWSCSARRWWISQSLRLAMWRWGVRQAKVWVLTCLKES